MKKIISGTLAVVILLLQLFVAAPYLPMRSDAAADLQCGEHAVWDLDGKGVLTISGTGAVYRYKRDDLGEPPWYPYASAVTSVVVEEGITAISARMLTCLSKLKSLSLPASLEAIVDGEEMSPAWCCLPKTLSSITVAPDSSLRWCPSYTLDGTQWFKNLPAHQPVYLGNLLYCIKDGFTVDTSLTIREGTLALGQYALGHLPDAKHVIDVTFPASLQYIGSYGVQNTGWYTAQPDGPVYAGHVFAGYKGGLPLSDSDFTVADGTIGIADGAFLSNQLLTSVTLPASLRTIGNSAFAYCRNLTDVRMSTDTALTDIGKYAFQDCNQLAALALPDSLVSIGEFAFPNGITALDFGRCLREIGSPLGAKLRSIHLSVENPYYTQDDAGVIYSADGKVLALSPVQHSAAAYAVADGCKQIRKYAFAGCELASVTFPASLTWIRSYAFAGASLLSVRLPASLQAVGDYAFNNCKQLRLVDFGTAPVAIDNQAFRQTGLAYVRIPDTVVSIESGAFSDNAALTAAHVPAGVLIEHGYCFPSSTQIYCYADSWIANHCQTNNYPYTLITQGAVSTDAIYALFLRVIALDRSLYESAGLAALDAAYQKAQLATLAEEQAAIDAAAARLEAALQALTAAPTPYTVGEVVSFGSYPQTRMDDAALIAQLNALPQSWQSYGYVSGDGTYGSMQADIGMEYCDVMLHGVRYRGVCLHHYRPYSTIEPSTTDDHEQRYPNPDGGYTFYALDTVYWFRYEPIQWRVLDAEKNLLITDAILDAQPYQAFVYQNGAAYSADTAGRYAANDYAHTTVRQWLNTAFYATAFTAAQQAHILPTQIPGMNGRSAVTDPVFLLGSNSGDTLAFHCFRQNGTTYTKANRVSDYAGIQGSDYETGGSLVRGMPTSADTLHTSFMLRDTVWENEFPVHNVVSVRPVICLTAPLQTDTGAIEQLLAAAAAVDRTLYSDDSLQALDAALEAAQTAAAGTEQTAIDAAAEVLQAALNSLEYKPADTAALREAQAQAAAIDRALYTADSLAALDAALAAAPEQADITQQAAVDESAAAIRAALEALAYLPADYTAVDAAIAQANALDLTRYSDSSAAAVRTAVAAVDRTLNCTQQAQADAYAAAILDAIERLAYAAVILRHEATGVIVSGTTLELDRSTALAVDLVDPADHEGANYAVGGKIKSLTFYDINLLLGGQRVQPAGMVTVRILLQDGVDPAKCKVYHVTDDLVNPLVRFANTIDGNYVVFQTDHFSEFAIIEVETVLDHIEIASAPAQTTYALGETFRPAGLSVRACFSDGTSESVTDYELAAVSTDTLGQKKVTVYYTHKDITKSASFFIQVVAPAGSYHIALRTPSVTTVRFGDTLYLYSNAVIPNGARIEWSYSGTGLRLRPSSDGRSCAVTCTGSGKGTVTAAVTDAAGMIISVNETSLKAELTLTANGSILQRILSIFKNLLHMNRDIDR